MTKWISDDGKIVLTEEKYVIKYLLKRLSDGNYEDFGFKRIPDERRRLK